MYDGKLFLDRFNREHAQHEHQAEAVHLADRAEDKKQHWSLGLSPLEQAFSIISILLLALVLYGLLRLLF